jgi:hypothetical protein
MGGPTAHEDLPGKVFVNWWHRLSSLCPGSRLVVHSLERLCH